MKLVINEAQNPVLHEILYTKSSRFIASQLCIMFDFYCFTFDTSLLVSSLQKGSLKKHKLCHFVGKDEYCDLQ